MRFRDQGLGYSITEVFELGGNSREHLRSTYKKVMGVWNFRNHVQEGLRCQMLLLGEA